ncbi:hypothetical protein RRG08_050897 [Elysia crispata]|uniref:EF-hand domain-containing protein n=1 Tax=Elysia crispata TaxID=231223 RepID=A0AAE0ZSX7_9GAST|nr:hypothetical protein RRG08_050897 [Elysia crispata]
MVSLSPPLQPLISHGDGRVCQAEWTSYRTGYLGFSRQFSEWHWRNITLEDCVDLSHWTLNTYPGDGPRDVKSVKDFKAHTIQLLLEFCQEDNWAKMAANRDCLSLVSLCRENRPDLEACHVSELHSMTLKEKIINLQRFYDVNNDGVITSEEMQSMLSKEFDTSADQCITRKEWTDQLTSAHGFSRMVAEVEWSAAGGDKSSCAPISQLAAASSEEVRTYSAAADMMGRIIATCDATPELYDSLSECVMVPYTCVTHFPTMTPCRKFIDRCGVSKARDCISGLTDTQCIDHDGRMAVAKELTSLDNHINDICDPYPFDLVDDPVSSACRTALDSCAQDTLTEGRCSDTWFKLLLDMMRRDVTNNCLDDKDDVTYDLRNNYDVDGDGKICEAEWQTRRENYLGLSAEFIQHVWQNQYTDSCLPVDDFYNGINFIYPLKSVKLFKVFSLTKLVPNFIQQWVKFSGLWKDFQVTSPSQRPALSYS